MICSIRASLASLAGSLDSFPRFGPLERQVMVAKELSESFPTDLDPVGARVVGEVVGEFPQAPAGERLAEGLGSGVGRRDDERFVTGTDQAGTATRPPRVQAGHAHLVEPVDDLPDRVLVRLDQPRDHRHGVAAG
jgi:hypothetical protein